jgi:hypothetical protein
VFSIALHPLAVHLFVSPDFNATYDDIVGYKKEVVGSLLLTATDACQIIFFKSLGTEKPKDNHNRIGCRIPEV